MEWPHPFIMQMATDLRPRLQGLIRQLGDVEAAPKERRQTMEEDEDDLPAFQCVFRLVTLFVEKVDTFAKEVRTYTRQSATWMERWMHHIWLVGF